MAPPTPNPLCAWIRSVVRILPSCPWFLSALLIVAPSTAFSRSPTDLLAWAAQGAPPSTAAAEILLDSTELTIHPDGREVWHTVLTYRVLDSDSLPRHLQEVREDWNWTSTRPVIRARVVSPDGTALVRPVPAHRDARHRSPGAMYSDRRILRGPLPAIARGAVVEVETRSTVTPWARSGANFRIPLQNFYPTRKLTARVELP